MYVTLDILCAGVAPEHRKMTFEAPEGATVEYVLTQFARKYDAPSVEKKLHKLKVLVDNVPSGLDRILCDGECVTVLRQTIGG